MTPVERMEWLLQTVTERIGDPAPRVYARLFEQSPELLPLFVGDRSGSVRAEMFLRAIDTLVDLAAGRPYAPGMIASERVTHGHNGIEPGQFDRFFHLIGEVFREALGSDWSADLDAAWQRLMAQVAAVHGHASA